MLELSSPSSVEIPNPIEHVDGLLDQVENVRHADYQQAILIASEAHRIAVNANYPRGVAKSLYHIADGYLRLGNYASASTPAQQALMTARENSLAIEEAYALSSLGAVYAYLGDEAEAMNLFFQQLEIAQQHHHLTLMGYAFGDLGSLYLRSDDYHQGLELIAKSNQIFDELGHEEEKYFWYFEVGSFYMRDGNFLKAYKTFEAMHELGQRKEIVEAKILGLTGMARAKSELHEYVNAHIYLDEALSIVRQTGSMLECEVLMEQGKTYLLQKRYDIAIEAFSLALKLATKTDNWNILLEAQRLLCEVYEKTDNLKLALYHNRAYHEARDKNFNDRSYGRTQALRALYEIETVRKEAEIHQLRSEAAERELKEYKEAESRRLEFERLKVTLDKERELVTLKDRILMRLSHEFRTPLAIIRTSTEILTRYADRLTEEKRQVYQGRIDEQFKVIEKHLSDIGMILKTDQQDISNAKDEVSLDYLGKLAIREAQGQLGVSDRIDLTISSNANTIWTEKLILLEVMTNLLSNALKFSEGRVSFNVKATTENLTFEIRDSGIGIPQNEQEKVFEALYRASNNDEVRGNGLGLSIVRDYVMLIGGSIRLQSAVNQGTLVSVSIPLSAKPSL